ncbi:phthiocerol/phthiodiolone dimycocerosyl transferase family protein [Pedobacter sp.]|jgi:hypothetical protein|uniref:phthiocerol/phthiodiolone dimycocerosyl transferase family protein n=1 Tax=Pedobacter sp. TaxID=1411316 RepID=UPI002CBD4FE3|nr:condensation domain-containing protein [Pedobacter sp.]HWW42163.1 condensation domain-containing protein [Pedobacter sp.]
MRRRLIIGERIMYVDAVTPLNCVFAVKIRGDFSLENLRAALAKVQQKHPLLRARIQEDAKGIPHFTSSNHLSEIPVRVVDRQSDEDWKQESEREWSALFDDKDLPLARVVWIKGASVSDLILVCPHCVCDGTTFVALMTEVLQLLDQPDREIGSYPPFDSIAGLLSESYSSSPSKIFKARIFSVLASVFFLFKSSRKQHPAGKGYLLHWKLDKESTAALMDGCKASGVTLHSALCVAFLEAFHAVKGDRAHGKVICPVDVRRFVKEIKEDHMFAFAPIAELSIEKGTKIGFLAKAQQVKEDLDTKISAMKVHELLFMSEYFHASVPKMVRYLRSTDGTHDFTFSNMGRLGIPGSYGSFELDAIYSPSVGFPWRNPNTLVVSTFKGEMDFSFYSNTVFLDPQEATAIKDQALLMLQRETTLEGALL